MRLSAAILVSSALAISLRLAGQTVDAEFFERKIRPLLAENCYSCHGTEKQKGNLRLDSPAAIRTGGESGPILESGHPEKSRLIEAVEYQNPDFKMPPKRRLNERAVSDLIAWVRAGAPMPKDQPAPHLAARSATEHWAFKEIRKPLVPTRNLHPVDAFVNAKLAEQSLTNNGPATRRELIRRASFDLLGIPPSPDEVAAFENDRTENAFERVLDRMLASPLYGERWARHWLDLVRFAQSNGYERDGEKLLAWRYRDYVIRAFNDDKPYDRFILEQLAGDELPDGSVESVIATGFQRLGVFDDEPDDKQLAEYDALDDILSTTGTAFLGLTIGCARCHDHKFDPIPQSDYYSLLAFFRGVRPFESGPPNFESAGFAPLTSPAEAAQWRAWKKTRLAKLQEQLKSATDGPRKKKIETEIAREKADVPYEWALAVTEVGAVPPATHILIRGNPSSPGKEVQPRFPGVLSAKAPELQPVENEALSSRRRLALAQWIASPQNPLTARVLVNRIWQHHFGRGLVSTPGDFGRAGAEPSHPELLDWLAGSFMENGWSIKKLHRTIMLSEVYQQSSRSENERAMTLDPDNRLLWRQSLRRLEAEAIRDTLLAVSGQLNLKMSGRGFFPHLDGEVLAGQSRPGLDWDVSPQEEQSRRSIYAFVRRTMGVPLFETFDYANTTSPLTERSTTTVAPQSLMLLNDRFVQRAAAAMASRVAARSTAIEAQITTAYQLAFNRNPKTFEIETLRTLYENQAKVFAKQRSQLSFALDVPNALSTEYFEKLTPAQFLLGPTNPDWSYFRGVWAPPYEGIRVAERDQGPFALWCGRSIRDGVLSAELLFSPSSEGASLLFRGRAREDRFEGWELLFDPRGGQIQLKRHEQRTTVVARNSVSIPALSPLRVKIDFHGNRVRVFVGDEAEPVLATSDMAPIVERNFIGVRTLGGPLTMDHLQVVDSAGRTAQIENTGTAPLQKALGAVCLALLNLNELIYID